MPNSGSPSAGDDAVDQLHAGPDAAGILPAAAGAAEPFAENRARRHQPPVLFLESTGQAPESGRWRACTRAIRQASRFVETASREPLGMSFTLLTISIP